MYKGAYYIKILSNTEDTACFSYIHTLLETSEQLILHKVTPHKSGAHMQAQFLRLGSVPIQSF